MDMGTERVVSQITRDKRISLFHKLSQYDRYLQSLRYRQTYAAFGDFRFFTLLFVTIGEQRIENIRREMERLPREFSDYYRLTTYERAMGDFSVPSGNPACFPTPQPASWLGRQLTRRQFYAAPFGTLAKRQGF